MSIDNTYSSVLNAFAVITAVVFVVMTSFQKNAIGDLSFTYHKMILFSFTIVAGYFISTLGDGDVTRNLEILPGWTLGDQGLFDIIFTSIPFLSTIISFLAILWMAVALGLLPLGHTVIESDTGETDEKMSNQLMIMYKLIYIYPFQIVTFFLALTASIFIWKAMYSITFSVGEEIIKKVTENLKSPQNVIGFYSEKSV
jgi:hypothetical protein